MRTGLALLLVGMLAVGCGSASDETAGFILPAEWEAHDAVWVNFFGGPMDSVAFDMVKAIAPSTPVKCVVPAIDITGRTNHRLAYMVRAKLGALGVDPARIEIVKSDSLVQMRDTGPIFVRNGAGELRIVDFRWNDYGDPAALHASYRDSYPFDSIMAAKLQIPVIESDLVMEGGALETNGQGTLLQVEALTLQRNPGWSRDAVEAELKRVLGQKKIIWLREGSAEDPQGLTLITGSYLGSGVGGHVDEFARFVDARTILLAFPDSAEAARDPVKRITRERMEVNYEILKDATDQDGRPFEIVKVPVPDVPYTPLEADTGWSHPAFRSLLAEHPSIRHGDTLYWVPASSYLNYFVTNDVVLIPKYWEAGAPPALRETDRRFREVMERFYPDRKIVAINPLALNSNGGGLHCWTQQQPARR